MSEFAIKTLFQALGSELKFLLGHELGAPIRLKYIIIRIHSEYFYPYRSGL